MMTAEASNRSPLFAKFRRNRGQFENTSIEGGWTNTGQKNSFEESFELEYTVEKGIANSEHKIKIESRGQSGFTFSLLKLGGQEQVLRQYQIKGLNLKGKVQRSFWDNFFIKLNFEGDSPQIEFCARMRGGSKIPVLDEVIRCFGSLGDVLTGHPEKADKRWEDWPKNSFIANAGKSIGFGIVLAGKKIKDSDDVEEYERKAKSSGQRLLGTVISAGTQAGGIALQALTIGIPNPASGSLLQFSSKTGQVIDSNVRSGVKGITWEQFGKQGGIGAARGAISSGGLVPYTATALQNKIRGKKDYQFNHKQELANSGITALLTAATVGTVKGVGKLSSVGKIGFKRAATIGFSSGFISGIASGLILRQIHTCVTNSKLKKEGYQFDRNQQKDGTIYAVYVKKGEKDIIVPCPELGDIVGGALLQGVMSAVSCSKEYYKNRPKKFGSNTTFTGQADQTKTSSKGRAHTAEKVKPTQKSEQRPESKVAEMIKKGNNLQSEWIKVSSQGKQALKVLKKFNPNTKSVDLILFEHAGPEKYGSFKVCQIDKFTHLLNKYKQNLQTSQGIKVGSLTLFGCEVTGELKSHVQAVTGLQVKSLPQGSNSELYVKGNGFKYTRHISKQTVQVIRGNVIDLPDFAK